MHRDPQPVRSFLRRLPLACLLGSASLVGCSGEPASFCNQAFEFVQFEPGIAEAATSPDSMRDFVSEWRDRLGELTEVAPPEALTELSLMRAGVEQLQADLAAVEYELLELPLEQLDNPEADDASARFDLLLHDECQISPEGAELLVPAPDPLDDDEFDDLVDSDADTETVEAELQQDLRLQLGLTQAQSECFTDQIDFDQLEELVSGVVSDATGLVLIEALASCEIAVE